MGKILDFFLSDFTTFWLDELKLMCWNLIRKSLGIVPFRPNLTNSIPKCDITSDLNYAIRCIGFCMCSYMCSYMYPYKQRTWKIANKQRQPHILFKQREKWLQYDYDWCVCEWRNWQRNADQSRLHQTAGYLWTMNRQDELGHAVWLRPKHNCGL